MKITQTNKEKLVQKYKVVVLADEFKKAYQEKLAETAKKVKLAGFRPGNVPMNVVEQKYGQAVKGDTAEALIQEASKKMIDDNHLKLASAPQVEITQFEDNKDFEFTMDAEVLPEMPNVDLTKLQVEKPVAEVSDKEVNDSLKKLAEARRETEVVQEKRPTQKNDVVVIDFTGKIDGLEFRGGSGKDYYLCLGSNTFIPGFEDQLTGKNVGDKVIVNVKFPENYHAKEMAGKSAVFETTIKELRIYKQTPINDELAKSLGQESLDALKKLITEELSKEYANVSKVHLKRAILDALDVACKCEVPQSMLNVEFDAIWKQYEEAKKKGQLDEDEKKAKEEDLKKEYKEIASRRVKLGLLLADIASKNKITLEKADLSKAIAQEASRYPGQEKAVFDFYQKNPKAVDALRAPLFEEKVVDFIASQLKTIEKKMTPAELYAFDPDKK